MPEQPVPPMPSMPVRRDLVFWAVVLASFLGLVWLLSDVLLPFVLGMAIAYVVDPVVVWLERRGFSRGAAAGVLVGSSFAAGVLTTLVVGPVLFEQAAALLGRLPDILAAAYAAAEPILRRMLRVLGVGPQDDVPAVLVQAAQRVESMLAAWAALLPGRGLALLNLLGLLSVTPLVAFYLLRDWPRILAHIDGWLPRDYAETIRSQAREADRALAGFARGAAIVCALLAAFYGVALSLTGLDFGLLIGLMAGALSFVPYLGMLVGLGASVGMALIQLWPDWVRVAIVAGIFIVGNFVADYLVTPYIVGDRIKVHPLWVLFGFFAGGTLFGFVGMLISVPACALIGVVARFAIAQYRASAYYRGSAA